MNKAEHSSVDQAIAAMRVELASARNLLLMYEEATRKVDHASSGASQHLQGFDLAIQILADLEHLSSLILSNTDSKQLNISIPIRGLRLERLHVSLQGNDANQFENKSEFKSVDLF